MWSAQSQEPWIVVTDGNSGQGFGQVTLDVLENPSILERTGLVFIGGNTFSVTQTGQPCDYSIVTDTLNLCADGESLQIPVSATAGCNWEISADEDWIELILNSQGEGDEVLGISISPNNSETNRIGAITLTSSDMNTQLVKNLEQQGYLIFEDFQNAVLPEGFLTSPDDSWSVSNGQLQGNLINQGLGIALEFTADAYCSDCKTEGSITLTSLTSNPSRNIGLIAWYKGPNDYVSLAMDEFSNLWRLSLFNNSVESFIELDGGKLITNQQHDLSISYDNKFIYGWIDGSQVIQLEHNLLVAPVGFPGYFVDNAAGKMGPLKVSGSGPADFDLIFSNSFETVIFVEPTICAQ